MYEQKKEGATLAEIATFLGLSKSTICRELARNTGERGYRPKQAHERATDRGQVRRGDEPVCPRSWRRCQELLRMGHSPAKAVGRAALEGYTSIRHEPAYKRI
jgi:IS30 family transposase